MRLGNVQGLLKFGTLNHHAHLVSRSGAGGTVMTLASPVSNAVGSRPLQAPELLRDKPVYFEVTIDKVEASPRCEPEVGALPCPLRRLPCVCVPV